MLFHRNGAIDERFGEDPVEAGRCQTREQAGENGGFEHFA
jgi:hypothetical protein